jgi:thiamine-phosphate pyrophosphorylase
MFPRCLLYYITDRSQFHGDEQTRRHALLENIAEAVRAGVDYIQLREKDLRTRHLQSLAEDTIRTIHAARPANNERRTALLINSRTDIALAAGADGVHLRSQDVSPMEVRRVWALSSAGALAREKPIIATSCHNTDDVNRAQSQGADFAVFAPVFEKNNAPEVQAAGLAALQEACCAKIPVLALGGVTMENASACLQAGAAGIAGIRLFQENKIEDVVRALRSR